MKVLVATKVVLDSEDIAVNSDRSLDYSKSKAKISEYDTNALEVATTLGADSIKVISVGNKLIDDSKVKKNILSRGADELLYASSDAYENLDAHATAKLLAELANKADGFDLIILGDGSADHMAQQVDVQLARELSLPLVTAVSKIEVEGDALKLERILEDRTQVVKVALPAVVSVVPDVAQARIPGMKDILAAGKKPNEKVELGEVSNSIEEISRLAPEQVDRAQNVSEANEDSIAQFVEALKARI